MARLYLVRHGRAAAGFDAALDPGLAPDGRIQAERTAARLAPSGPLPIVTSPLARARETARPLEVVWGVRARVEPRVSEIPSPTDDLVERSRWLGQVMAATWTALDEPLRRWRNEVLGVVRALEDDTVVTTHFIVVNVVIGEATGDDRVVSAAVDNASVTVLDVHPDGTLQLVERGREASTEVR